MTDAEKLRDYFFGWQCRLRQHAVRQAEGRPSQGMQATVTVKASDKILGPVNFGLVKSDSASITSEFQHIAKKTHDPNVRQQAAIKLLSAVYYQYPKEFADCLTATFATDSALAKHLVEAQKCELQFKQHQQQFHIACKVRDAAEDDAAYQTTYWHNLLFNPVMPGKIKVLTFMPKWKSSTANPAVI